MAQIVLHGVTKTYRVDSLQIDAVQNISLTIERGDFVSIVGHSGSGKTTLLSMIGGVTSPTAGRIFFEEHDLSTLDSDGLSEYRGRKIGFMFQFASLLPLFTVKENLLLPAVFSETKSLTRAASQKAADLLEMVGLRDKMQAYPSQLSGGQQRRVAIARAFMNDPAVILADEPTGDLDEETEQNMMNFFMTMNNVKQTTFIMVTHNTDLANRTQRRIRMHQGRIVEV